MRQMMDALGAMYWVDMAIIALLFAGAARAWWRAFGAGVRRRLRLTTDAHLCHNKQKGQHHEPR